MKLNAVPTSQQQLMDRGGRGSRPAAARLGVVRTKSGAEALGGTGGQSAHQASAHGMVRTREAAAAAAAARGGGSPPSRGRGRGEGQFRAWGERGTVGGHVNGSAVTRVSQAPERRRRRAMRRKRQRARARAAARAVARSAGNRRALLARLEGLEGQLAKLGGAADGAPAFPRLSAPPRLTHLRVIEPSVCITGGERRPAPPTELPQWDVAAMMAGLTLQC